ncbi:hypothetical protein [Microvirga sp. P5_D2]|jgi:hypothetical protein
MNLPASERPFRPNDPQAELDQFGHQAASLLALVLTLSGMTYAILMQVFL